MQLVLQALIDLEATQVIRAGRYEGNDTGDGLLACAAVAAGWSVHVGAPKSSRAMVRASAVSLQQAD